MKATYTNLTNSRYYNPAFNSAIFDGPIRIYFAQVHESLALKIYFGLQQKYGEVLAPIKQRHRAFGRNVLVMLYPTKEAFQMSFEGHGEFVIEDRLGDDTLIGINGPFEDGRLQEILGEVAGAAMALQEFSETSQREWA